MELMRFICTDISTYELKINVTGQPD